MRELGLGIFRVSDCWRDGRDRWFQGGLHHEQHKCACPCHCNTVFVKLDRRFGHLPARSPSPFDLDGIIEGLQDEIQLQSTPPPIVPQLRCEESGDSLCASCCHCVTMREQSEDCREQAIPQVSLFYAAPTLLRDLCGVAAFAPAVFCSTYTEEHCKCQGLWLDFFQEVMNAYAERYSDLVREISSVFFSSLQSDLSIGSFSLEQRLSFLQSAWNCYHVCCDRKLFSEKDCKVFYGSLVMAVINLIVYASYDEDALFSVCSWSEF